MNYITGGRSIYEEQIKVLDAVFREFDSIVFGLVQPHNAMHSEVLKYLDIIFRLVTSLLPLIVHWTHEGYELVWNNPIQVPIFNLFIILVLLGVKVLELVPP